MNRSVFLGEKSLAFNQGKRFIIYLSDKRLYSEYLKTKTKPTKPHSHNKKTTHFLNGTKKYFTKKPPMNIKYLKIMLIYQRNANSNHEMPLQIYQND